MNLKVGLPTAGKPRMEKQGDLTLLHNLRIGCSFHWERSIPVLLPGEIRETGRDDFQLINSLPLETYLKCVVGAEMSPAAPAELLKAHAVISRGWVVGKILGLHPASHPRSATVGWEDSSAHNPDECGFHICADDHCQRYQGLQNLSPEREEAVDSTAGLILISAQGEPVDARFSKCCGGKTELFSTCWQEQEMPCLRSVEDPWCDLSNLPGQTRSRILKSILKDYDADIPAWRWEEKVPKSLIALNLRERFATDLGEILSMEAVERGPSGRIKYLRIRGTSGETLVGKELWIRRLLSETHLYSSAFEATDCGEYFMLRGKGWGHGVGLCQIGAARMALEGRSWSEILEFYYPGSGIGHISEVCRQEATL